MVVAIVALTIVVFIIVDILLRLAFRRIEAAKVQRERAKALEIGLRTDYSSEARSLKRVEVGDPRARILAVDDEEIVLDSFRKILVTAGYSVDTVENGPEALGLLRKNDYDFLFTDFKMPDMDGVEVTKAAKHLRPDVDVVMITGYANIESAVETMKHGAMDYVEKPFTADELTDLVNKLTIQRQDRLEKELKPEVRLVTPSVGASDSRREFNVPAGVFVSPSHSWVRVLLNGMVRVGIDDFTQKTIGRIDSVELPARGGKATRGEPLFSIQHGDCRLSIPSPITGTITATNTELLDRPELVKLKPYELGWFCSIEPENLTRDLRQLRIGEDAITWYREEIEKFTSMIKEHGGPRRSEGRPSQAEKPPSDEVLDAKTWPLFSQTFIQRSEPASSS